MKKSLIVVSFAVLGLLAFSCVVFRVPGLESVGAFITSWYIGTAAIHMADY